MLGGWHGTQREDLTQQQVGRRGHRCVLITHGRREHSPDPGESTSPRPGTIRRPPRRSAICASRVMASHSSKMMSLNLLLRWHRQGRPGQQQGRLRRSGWKSGSGQGQSAPDPTGPHPLRQQGPRTRPADLKMLRVPAKSWISLRTMEMPRSSEALSSSTMFPVLGPYSSRARARMVEVFPVPGGPYSSRWGSWLASTNFLTAQGRGQGRGEAWGCGANGSVQGALPPLLPSPLQKHGSRRVRSVDSSQQQIARHTCSNDVLMKGHLIQGSGAVLFAPWRVAAGHHGRCVRGPSHCTPGALSTEARVMNSSTVTAAEHGRWIRVRRSADRFRQGGSRFPGF